MRCISGVARRTFASLSALIVMAAALSLAQREPERDTVRNPLARDAAAIEAGRTAFQARCAFCHGTDARGTGRGSNLTTGRFAHGGRDSQLFKTIRSGVPGTPMPPNEMSDTEAWQLVSFIRSVGIRGHGAPVPGDVARGETIFFGKGGCASCHMIRGRGSPFGPELSRIGEERSSAAIRRSILEPDAEMPPDYAAVRIELRGGGRVEGIVRNEDSFSIQLVDREGRIRALDKARVAALQRVEKKSLMPASAGAALQPDELQDLLAFLDRQRPTDEGYVGHDPDESR